jgi:hypothetical protein
MQISRDVTFDESSSFYPWPTSNVSPQAVGEPLSFLTSPNTPISTVLLPPLPSPPSPPHPPSSPSPPPPPSPPLPSKLPSHVPRFIYASKPPVIHTYSVASRIPRLLLSCLLMSHLLLRLLWFRILSLSPPLIIIFTIVAR